MRHVSRLSEGVTGSIYDIRTGCLCVCVCLCASIAKKVCVEKVGREEIQVNVATYHIRRVRRVLSMRARARVFHLPLISAKVVFVLNKVRFEILGREEGKELICNWFIGGGIDGSKRET